MSAVAPCQRVHAPSPGHSEVHRDVVVVYLPNGNARRYCPDYGKFWTLKFATDLKVDYFTPEDAERRGLVVWALSGRSIRCPPAAAASSISRTRMVAIAEAEAAAVKARADGEAYANLKVATAQAEALTIQNAALSQLELRRIEVERTKAENWNGQLPQNVYAGRRFRSSKSTDPRPSQQRGGHPADSSRAPLISPEPSDPSSLHRAPARSAHRSAASHGAWPD
jgi:hypothetical protein